MSLFRRPREDVSARREAERQARRTIGRDIRRGRPDFDLRDWAAARHLEFRDGVPQAGYLQATCPWSTDLLFNVVRGSWRGGTEVVVCHDVRIHDVDHDVGEGHGERVHGGGGWAVLAVNAFGVPWGPAGYTKVPHTSAAVRAPHLATVTGLHVARRSERPTGTGTVGGAWDTREAEVMGLADRWVVSVRRHSDPGTVDALVRGPIRDLLLEPRPPGFEVRIEYGQVVASRPGFLRNPEQLDELADTADHLGTAVRTTCCPPALDGGLANRLPPPPWLDEVRALPGDAHTQWPTGTRLEQVVQVADERRLAIEDPRAFHQAFPSLNLPGEAFAVLRGRLPGTRLDGRLLCCAERPMVLPDDFRRFLTDPGGKVGCDVAVLPVDPGTPDTPPAGERRGDIRVAVAGDVFTAWRTRPRWQVDGGHLDALALDVATIVGHH